MPSLSNIFRYCTAPNPTPTKEDPYLRPNYYDMNAYMLKLITEKTDYTYWKNALDKAIYYAVATPWWYSMYSGKEHVNYNIYSGISCYVPQNNSTHNELNSKFATTSWYHAAGWEQAGW